ncbi:MAG: UPF0164 family protein [bacterium]|nr:UPF0164 family protein [bacterium]
MKRLKYILCIIFILTFKLFAAEGAGTKSMEFLNIPVGARPVGMGESYTAVSDDIFGILWNPAGLFNLESEEISFTYNQYIEDIHQGYIAFASPQYQYGGFASSLLYLKTSGIEEYDKYDNRHGTFATYSMAYILSYIKKLDNLGIGVNVKLLEEKLYKKKYTGEALDLGAKYILNDYLSFGAAILNISQGVKYHTKREDLPLIKKIGTSFNYNTTTLALDYIQDEYKSQIAIGAEYHFMNTLYLRCGYKTSEDLAEGIRLGFGLNIKNAQFDYALTRYENFGWMNQFSLTFKIGRLRNRQKGPNLKFSDSQRDFLNNLTILNKKISKQHKKKVSYRKNMDYIMMNINEKERLYNHQSALEKMNKALDKLAKENTMLIKNMEDYENQRGYSKNEEKE